MSRKGYITTSIIFMFISAMMISLAFVYYKLEDKAISYRYSDVAEYTDINEGIKFIDKLPIQFNIINKYFSDMNNLSQTEKEQIVLAYAIKNNYKQFNCGPSTSTINYTCIKKEDLESLELNKLFNTNFAYENNKIDIYLDNYGSYEVSNKEDNSIYKFIVDVSNNKNYKLYTKFDKFKQDKDSYIFYVYQGFINANTPEGNNLAVYDFIEGKPVYTGISNGHDGFKEEDLVKISNLQKYKYELKKHDDGTYYLYGYNPVKNFDK